MLNFVEVSDNKDVTRFPLKFTAPGQDPLPRLEHGRERRCLESLLRESGGRGCSRSPGEPPPRGAYGPVGDGTDVNSVKPVLC